MSKLEELIKEFCPNGVEYKKLTDIASVLYGYPCDAALFNESGKGRPLARIRDVLAGRTNTYSTENVPEKYILTKGDLLVGMDGNFHTAIWQVDNAIICQRVCKIYSKDENILLNGFLFHLLRPLMRQIENNKQSGTVKHLLDKDIKAIVIPLPALPVQREIVRILDSFTLYSAELTAELTARRKQYEFYRDKLLNFDSGNIQRVKLKDICGKVSNIKWQNDDNEYAYIDLSSVDRETHKITIEQRINKENAPSRAQQIVNKGDVLFATTRPTLKRYCKITEEFNGQICSTGFVVLRPKINIILSTYLYYIVSSDRFFTYVEKNQEGTSYPAISDSKVKEFDFSLPPIDVQERIVKVLDNFDAICSDLGIGLPAEIEKRQKQYEYYRDKLLTFEEKNNNGEK